MKDKYTSIFLQLHSSKSVTPQSFRNSTNYYYAVIDFNPGKTGIFFTPRKRSTRAKPGFFSPPANVQPGQNRDFTDPVEGLPFDAQKPFEG